MFDRRSITLAAVTLLVAGAAHAQQANDALGATQLLKQGFDTDVTPLLQQVRLEAGGAIDPLSTYRASGYRARVAEQRPASNAGGGGIV